MKRSLLHKVLSCIFLLILLFILPGCEKIRLGEPYDCRIGIRYWPGTDLSFSVDSIRDYRCPKDVMCFWGGDVDLFLSIYVNLDRTDTLIRLYRNNPLVVKDYIFEVLEVNPWRNAGQVVDEKDYRIRIKVTEQ